MVHEPDVVVVGQALEVAAQALEPEVQMTALWK